jgi:hypothetical protein
MVTDLLAPRQRNDIDDVGTATEAALLYASSASVKAGDATVTVLDKLSNCILRLTQAKRLTYPDVFDRYEKIENLAN